MGDERIERIRAALVEANKTLSHKVIHKIIRQSGLPLKIGSDALGRFAQGLTKNLSEDADAKSLLTFLYSTETGRLLRGVSDGWTSAFDRVVGGLRVHLPTQLSERVDGHYFCFHGAISDYGKFTVRLLNVKREINAVVSVKCSMLARKLDLEPLSSEGFLVLDKGKFEILMLHKDDIIVLNLIVPYKAYPPQEGKMQSIWAQMLGITAEEHWFTRLLRIERISDQISPDEALKLTGTYSKSELPIQFIEYFKDLADRVPAQHVEDSVLEFDKIS